MTYHPASVAEAEEYFRSMEIPRNEATININLWALGADTLRQLAGELGRSQFDHKYREQADIILRHLRERDARRQPLMNL
jgi:hypothetical protein